MNQPLMTAHRLLTISAYTLMAWLGGAVTAPVAADAMRVGDFWYPDFSPVEYNDGFLSFNLGAVEQKKALVDIHGLKMDNYPTLALAEVAIKNKDAKKALSAFKSARVKAQEKWLQIWLDARILPLLNQTDQGMDAGKVFISLMESGAPVSLFIENPPIKSVRKATKDQKLFLQTKFKEKMKDKGIKEKSPIWYALEELAEAADPTKASTPTTAVVTQAGALASEIALPIFLLKGNPDAVTKLLARSQFDRAKERLAELVKTAGTGKTSLYLYQLGICDLYSGDKAAKAGDAAKATQLYKEAGLKFMRVTIHFPRSKVAGPALLEASLIHLKINRKDIASKLIKQTEESIDPDDEILMKRLDMVREMLNA